MTYSVMNAAAAYQVSMFQRFKTALPLIFNFETLNL